MSSLTPIFQRQTLLGLILLSLLAISSTACSGPEPEPVCELRNTFELVITNSHSHTLQISLSSGEGYNVPARATETFLVSSGDYVASGILNKSRCAPGGQTCFRSFETLEDQAVEGTACESVYRVF